MKKLIILLLFTLFAFASTIERYEADAYINSSGEVQVVEDILYNFEGVPHHGIYRDIPKNDTFITDIQAEQNSRRAQKKVIGNKNYIRIKIGDPNSYAPNLSNYKISYTIKGYTVRNSGDVNKIIMDLIGTGWRVPIKKAILRVHLPQVLAGRVKVAVFRGIFGSTEQLAFKEKGDIIEIDANDLAPHQGITISLAFDKNLIPANKKPTGEYYKSLLYYLILIPILGFLYLTAKKYNLLQDIGSISPKYNPPKGLSVLEAGVIKDNFADFCELKAGIVELANLGYIKYKEIDGEMYLERQEKDPSGLSDDLKLLLNAMFGGVVLVNTSFLKLDKKDFEAIKNTLHSNLVAKGYYSSSVRKARESFLYTAIVAALLTFGALFWYIFKDTGLENIFPVAVTSGFIAVGAIMFVQNLKSRDYSGLYFAVLWTGFSMYFLYSVVYSKGVFVSIAIAAVIIIAGIYFIYKKLNTLSLKGLMAKRYLLGLKEFISRAERDRIRFFLKEDKHFLDKLLPYAILFGLNKHWLNLYQELNAPLPDWYVGDVGDFGMIDFDTSSFFLDSLSADPSIDSGDFGDFGDFSGGGFDGGGGGDW